MNHEPLFGACVGPVLWIQDPIKDLMNHKAMTMYHVLLL